MSKDYYKILGLEKNASQDEIKKAFRKLAHEHHPDKKGGNDTKFKEANEAYSVLGDEKKRAQYDQFGSAGNFGQGGFGGFNGAGFNPNDFGFDFSGFQRAGGFSQGFGGDGGIEFDLGDILGGMFGGGRQRQRRGRHVQVDIDLTFEEAVFGVERTIHVLRKELSVKIPPGLDNGESVRLPGAGEPIEGGIPGDLYVRVHVKKHPLFRKSGSNLVADLSIKLSDALLGTTVTLK